MGDPLDALIDDGSDGFLFQPVDLTNKPPQFSLPDELWISVLESRCEFEANPFREVMENLIRNPDISSSYLFRAEIFYDSVNDFTISYEVEDDHFSSSFTKHMKAEYRPIPVTVPGYVWNRTIVRQLIPRNPQLDKPLVQTCHMFTARGEGEHEEFRNNLVIYVPHVGTVGEMPWYHPAVRSLAFLHTWRSSTEELGPDSWASCKISIHYSLFPDKPLDNRLQRTALSLLRLIHKHGNGRKAGYIKRVHHDLIIPQARFQNTYVRLKAKYAKALIGEWVEQTDPEKHVFEDLGIAAFLIELWKDLYAGSPHKDADGNQENGEARTKPPFPGFVDIGCGNGALVYVLLQEGYRGWGFDVRKRKTWETFPSDVQQNLKEMLLVPSIYQAAVSVEPAAPQPTLEARILNDLSSRLSSLCFSDSHGSNTAQGTESAPFHNGIFPHGTFIISNHADQLTPWTPLLAYLSLSPFIAIPCCSHNFAGARFRAPMVEPPALASSLSLSSHSGDTLSETSSSTSSGSRSIHDANRTSHVAPSLSQSSAAAIHSDTTSTDPPKKNAPETGSLKRKPHKLPSAYATLTSWVSYLATELGYLPEKEMLRIPSTRNACIVGRRWKPAPDGEAVDVASFSDNDEGDTGRAQREQVIKALVEREMGTSVGLLGDEWMRRVQVLQRRKGDGH